MIDAFGFAGVFLLQLFRRELCGLYGHLVYFLPPK